MMEQQVRLTPTMADFRLLVLAFVRDYCGRWGASPSYGEIAAALDSNRTRVRKAVKSLVASGLLLRIPGPRGLSLPSERTQAITRLRALGWRIDEIGRHAAPGTGVTNRSLPGPPVLDYIPPHGGNDNTRETRDYASG